MRPLLFLRVGAINFMVVFCSVPLFLSSVLKFWEVSLFSEIGNAKALSGRSFIRSVMVGESSKRLFIPPRPSVMRKQPASILPVPNGMGSSRNSAIEEAALLIVVFL